MKINTDLERIGDQAVNIAENVIKLLALPPLRPRRRGAHGDIAAACCTTA